MYFKENNPFYLSFYHIKYSYRFILTLINTLYQCNYMYNYNISAMYNFLFYVIFVKSALSFLSFYEAFFLTWKWIFLWIFVTVQFMSGICTRTPFFIAKMVMPTSHKLFYSGIYKVSLPGNFYIKTISFKNHYLVDVKI